MRPNQGRRLPRPDCRHLTRRRTKNKDANQRGKKVFSKVFEHFILVEEVEKVVWNIQVMLESGDSLCVGKDRFGLGPR